MFDSGVSVMCSRARRRISAAASAVRSFGSSWKRRSPRTRERTSSSWVSGAEEIGLTLLLLISGPFAERHGAQLRDRFDAEAEHADLELLDDAPHRLGDALGGLGGRGEERVGH